MFTPAAAQQTYTCVVAIANSSTNTPYNLSLSGTGADAKQDQTITFPPIRTKRTTDTVGLAATASSGLPVAFSVLSGPASLAGGTTLSFSGAGTVSIVASQAGNGSYNAAPNVTNTFTVVLQMIGGTMYGPYGWTNVGSGLGSYVVALAHDGTDLYAGGGFSTAGVSRADNIAQWKPSVRATGSRRCGPER